MIKFILIAVLLFVGFLISILLLFGVKKKDQKFDRKGIIYFSLISLLIFFVFGLVGLLYIKGPSNALLLSQGLAGLFGVFFAWFLFSNYDWADHFSFLPETLFVISLTFITLLGFLLGLWVWDMVFLPRYGYSMDMYLAVLWLPVPYLLLRSYDFMLQIPQRKYIAWQFPEEPTPIIDLTNVRYIYLDFYTRSKKYPAGRVTDLRSRIPLNNTFGSYFQNFVADYNEKNPDYPIINLRTDEENNPIGWVFYSSRTKNGRKRLINPDGIASTQLQEGDLVQARRLILGKAFTGPLVEDTQSFKIDESDDDDFILIQEKK